MWWVRTLIPKWRTRMLSKPKLSDYSRWKTKLEFEPYLKCRDPVARRPLARLRSTTHELRVERQGLQADPSGKALQAMLLGN